MSGPSRPAGAAPSPVAPPPSPPVNCPDCPRLVAFREENRCAFPTFFNAPVPSFGPTDARLLIVGLAPGLKGANRTGRPFTGDFAGDLLYATLLRFGFARGAYDRRSDDELRLEGVRITNAVRCVPPENKPDGSEIRTCRPYLVGELSLPRLKAVLALGAIAHDTVLVALGLTRSRFPFRHGARHALPNGLLLADSYHSSRYNQNTGRLTAKMFEAVVASLREYLEKQ